MSAFLEDSEQLEESSKVAARPESSPPLAAGTTFNVFATAYRFVYARLCFVEPIAGLPEVVRGDGPESAEGGKESSSAVKGDWSHALLLEMPVMACENKTHKHTQKLVFRQVRRGLLLAAFIAMTS